MRRRFSLIHRALLVLLLAAGWQAVATAQGYRAQLTGTITDQSGGVVPGVEVRATHLATGTAQTTISGETGIYRLLNLEPGQYRVEAELVGFKKFSQEPVTLRLDDVVRLDVRLEVGEVADVISVIGAAPLLETETASFGEVVPERSVQELPLAIRDSFGLIALTAGVIPGARYAAGYGTEVGRPQFRTDFKIGAGRQMEQEILLDGTPNSSVDFGAAAYLPPSSSTQEFKVHTNSFSAEYGRTTGGVLNMMMKSGTSEFHGQFYNFHRNRPFDANNFFANRAGQDKPPFVRNQFGFNVGGPIPIKSGSQTFFFWSYEGLRQGVPAVGNLTVPTLLQREGDFSQTFNSAGNLITIYDPLTLQEGPDGNLIRLPFEGNRIPQHRWDPVAAEVMNLFPLPNAPGHPVTGANNYTFSETAVTNVNNYNLRIDHNFGASNRIFGRYSMQHFENIGANPFPAFPTGLNDDSGWNVAIADTHTFSPTLMLDVRASYARHETNEVSPSFGFDLRSLGFPPDFAEFAQPFIPNFNVSGFQSIGRNRNLIQPRETPAAQISVSKQGNRHFLKFGADGRKYQFNVNRNLNSSGTFSFGPNFTQGPNPFQARADAGSGLASFLLGAGTGGSIFKEAALSLYRWYWAFYIQDDWKVTPRLTINLGLRYDLNIGTRERFDRLNSLNLEAPSPLAEQVGLPLRGILEFRGQGVSRDLFELDKNDFGPRIGLAYQFAPNTVVRLGYGIFYVPLIAINGTGTQGFEATTPWVTSLDGLTPLNLLSNPFPQGFNLPAGDRDPLTDVGLGISSSTRDNRTGYTQQWSLSIQRQFQSDLFVDLAYLGNKGTKLSGASIQMNQLPNEFLELGPALSQLVDNPFFGVIESGPLSGPQVARRQLLLPFPQYTSVSSQQPSWASSIYHAMTLRVEKRAMDGLSLQASYTISKHIDDSSSNRNWGGADSILDHYNRRAERSLSDLDTPQRLVLSYVYDLPFGAGKAMGSNLPPALNAIVGNWVFSGIATFQSGQPARVSRPSVNDGRSAKLDNPTIEQWFDTGAFSPAPAFTFGNVGPLLPDVRADGISNFDFTISKNFLVGERARVQFRTEFFNAFNTPQFGMPVIGVTAANFGQVTSQFNSPRAIQFGLQVFW